MKIPKIKCTVCWRLEKPDHRDDSICVKCMKTNLDYVRPEITKIMEGITPRDKSKILKEIMLDHKNKLIQEREVQQRAAI